MNELLDILNYISIYQGIFLVIILFNRKDNKLSNRILSLVLLISTLCSISLFLGAKKLEIYVYLLTFILFPLVFLFGPLLYLYTQSMTSNFSIFTKKNRYHLIPSLLSFIIYLSINSFNKDMSFDFFYTKNVILVFSVFILASVIIYAVLSWGILNSYSLEIENYFSNLEGLRVLWIKIVIGIISILFLSYIITTWINTLDTINSKTFISFINFLLMFVTAIFLLHNPDIFKYTYKSLEELTASKNEMNEDIESFKELKIKYEKTNIDDSRKDEYQNLLLRYMEESKPYLEEDITLKDLADELSIQPYHLSIIINERLNQNFFNFINSYRINEVINKFADTAYANKNILNIAFESGFNSKSSFNAAFKNLTGMTPTVYRKINTISKLQ